MPPRVLARFSSLLLTTVGVLALTAPPAAVAQGVMPVEAGTGTEELKAALESIRRRLDEERRAAGQAPALDVAAELAASRERIEQLSQWLTALRDERETLRQRLAAAEAEAAQREAAGRDEVARLTAELEAAQAALATSEGRSHELEQRLTADNASLRAMATAAVGEIRAIGEQLVQAQADKRTLQAAITEARASRELLDRQLAAVRLEGLPAVETVSAAPVAPAPAADPPADVMAALPTPAAIAPAAGLGLPGQAASPYGALSMVLRGTTFERGETTLTADAAAPLTRIAAVLQARPSLRAEIVGHTDDFGEDAVNLHLSKARANSVRDYLVHNFDLPPERFATSGMGEAQPVVPNTTPAGRETNRRVEVTLRP